MVQAKDPGTTGNFEVTVNGELVFSKRTRGQGFMDENDEGQQEVKAAIQKVLAAPPPYDGGMDTYT